MGSASVCFCCHKNRHLVIPLLFLLVSSSSLLRFKAEGRAIAKLVEATKNGVEQEEKMVVVLRTQMIGSRPPRCDRRCGSCGHCEAVQVPVTTQAQNNFNSRRRRSYISADAAFSNVAYSRGDDISNYKPMSWKCKCGDMILNP